MNFSCVLNLILALLLLSLSFIMRNVARVPLDHALTQKWDDILYQKPKKNLVTGGKWLRVRSPMLWYFWGTRRNLRSLTKWYDPGSQRKKRRDQTQATLEHGKNAPWPNPIGLGGQPNLVKQPNPIGLGWVGRPTTLGQTTQESEKIRRSPIERKEIWRIGA